MVVEGVKERVDWRVEVKVAVGEAVFKGNGVFVPVGVKKTG